MKCLIAVFVASSLCGCVMHDPKVATVKPAVVPLSAFSGKYSGKPSYNSKYFAGAEQLPQIENYVPFDSFVGDDGVQNIRIRFTPPQTVTFEALKADVVVARAVLIEGKHFDFASGVISLRRKTEAGGRDSPSFGVGTRATRFFLNEKNALVVAERSAGMGVLLVVPVAATGSGLVIFDRTEEAPNKPVVDNRLPDPSRNDRRDYKP